MLAFIGAAKAAVSAFGIGKAIAIGAAVVGVLVTVVVLRAQNGQLRAEADALRAGLDSAVAAAATNAAAFDRAKAEHARALAALKVERQRTINRTRELTRLKETIRNASDADDGPVADVLRDALDGLRDPAAEGGDRDPPRARARPGGAADVPAAAGAAP